MSDVYDAAKRYAASGLSVIPVKDDKRPAVASWKPFQERIATDAELVQWFKAGRHGVAIVAGAVSGGLLILDFDARADEVFPAWCDFLQKNFDIDAGILPTVRTGKGFHVYLRSDEPGRNRVLAWSEHGEKLIETRADGGYCVAPPTRHAAPAPWHGSTPYCMVYGDLAEIPTLDPATVAAVLSACGFFDEGPQEEQRAVVVAEPVAKPTGEGGLRAERYAAATIAKELSRVASAQEGSRNEAIYSAAKGLSKLAYAGLLSYGSNDGDIARGIADELRPHAAHYIASERDGEKAFAATVKSGVKAGKDSGWSMPDEKPRDELQRSTGSGVWPWPGAMSSAPATNGNGTSAPPEPEAPPPPEEATTPIVANLAGFNPTDTGNAQRLVALYGHNLRYVAEWRTWLHWNGRIWQRDAGGRLTQLAKDTARLIYAAASTIADDRDRERLVKHALRTEARDRLRAMIELAESEEPVAIQAAELDRHPFLLTVRNGVLDLRSGKLRPHVRGDLITRMVDVDYDPRATCPTWDSFLSTIFDGDVDLIEYYQRAVGYSLTGSTVEQCFFYQYGKGRNGKSTANETVAALAGDYYGKLSTEALLQRQQATIPNDLARLPGARFVVASEVEGGRRLAEALIKDMTGNEDLTVRFMRGEWWSYKPTFKLWLYGNAKLTIRGTDDGIWRRVRMIPFRVQIPEDRVDRHMPDRLRAELPGILAWAVRGALEWQARGLAEPASVIEATDQYRQEEDFLADFIADCCDLRATASEPASLLYQAFRQWTHEHGEKEVTQKLFGTMLRERGFQRERSSRGVEWLGLGLTDYGRSLADARGGVLQLGKPAPVVLG